MKIVKHWDELNPTVMVDGEAISTRVLEKKHRDCHAALVRLATTRPSPFWKWWEEIQRIIEETRP